MYKSKYISKPAKPRHQSLETVESFIDRHMPRPESPVEPYELPYDIRDRHVYVIGKPGHGKSTLLYSIASQDLANGAGMCVLDPKPNGRNEYNLVETLLRHIPPEREKDVIYFSPLHPIPLDITSWETEEERQILADDLQFTFMHLAKENEAGAQWPSVLKWAIHTLTEAKAVSFLQLYDFFTDEDFRAKVLKKVLHRPDLIKYWTKIYPRLPPDRTTPILTRLTDHLLVPPLQKILGCADASLSIHKAINDGKIILVQLSGAGQGTADFIGTLFVSRIQQAVFKGIKRNFYLFADEFQNFQTRSFIKILPEVRSLGLRLVLAHQYLDQLTMPGLNSAMRIIDNHFIFKLNPEDPASFKHLVPPSADGRVRPEILSSLPPYTALYSTANRASEFRQIPKPPTDPTQDELDRAERIRIRGIIDYPCNSPTEPHPSGSGNTQPPASSVTRPEAERTEPLLHDARPQPRHNPKKKNS